jgi:hypothetical protein
MVLERKNGKVTSLTESLDRWVNSFTWKPDSARLFFTTVRPRAPSHPDDSRSRAAPLQIVAAGR